MPHPGAVITWDEYTSDVPGYVNDLHWNFYDEIHRNHVHNTYHDMFKVFSGKSFSVNVVKWGNLPVFIQVANAKVAPNLFYQTMTIFGIFYLHQLTEMEQLDRKVRLLRRWYIVSHWLFRPLHYFLNKRLKKLQVVQDVEDNVHIRERRLALRDAGFHFATDQPDFTNSNRLTNNVILPVTSIERSDGQEQRLSLEEIQDNGIQNVKIGFLDFLVKRENGGVRVWPGICPHEGALLSKSDICDGVAQCHWHGRRFEGKLLTPTAESSWPFLGHELFLTETDLILRRADESLLDANI